MSTPSLESMGRIAPDAKPSHVGVPLPTASWLIPPAPLDRGSQRSSRVDVVKRDRGDYGRTVSVDGGNTTLLMSEDTARLVAAALLAAADWDPEAALLRRADEILHPPAPEEEEPGEPIDEPEGCESG